MGWRRKAVTFAVGAPLIMALLVQWTSIAPTSYYNLPSFTAFIPVALVGTCFTHLGLWLGKTSGMYHPPIHTMQSLSDIHWKNAPRQEHDRPVAIVTGSNTGIGFETARSLAVHFGYEVVLACRSKDKAMKARDLIQQEVEVQSKQAEGRGGSVTVLDAPLDLGSLQSVRDFAQEVRSKFGGSTEGEATGRLSVLINNAGTNHGEESGDGLHLVYQSNFLGHFLLTTQLLSYEDTFVADAKIINLASVMHHFADGDRPKDERYWHSYSQPPNEAGPVLTFGNAYTASKLAAILFTKELNRRFQEKGSGMTSLVVNPGSVNSDIWRHFPSIVKPIFGFIYLTAEQGATPVVAAAIRDAWETNAAGVVYLQPYWVPESQCRSPAYPPLEMLGPFAGYQQCTPRLPSSGGSTEGEALWKSSMSLLS